MIDVSDQKSKGVVKPAKSVESLWWLMQPLSFRVVDAVNIQALRWCYNLVAFLAWTKRLCIAPCAYIHH